MFSYPGVTTRFLHANERLIPCTETELPLVLEAQTDSNLDFLQHLLRQHSQEIRADIARYGAVLLRGFAIDNEAHFEQTVLSIQGMHGIGEAFMAEEGRIPVDNLQYVLHTNAVYKTGGTLYLGGFHSENYYSSDVPSYICFCCLKPSLRGGETGLIHTQNVYEALSPSLKAQLESQTFYVKKWLIQEVAERYQLPAIFVEKMCQQFGLSLLGEGKDKFVLLYKPSVFIHPETHKKGLQINFFELPTLNKALQQCFMADYQGTDWCWHRLLWQAPRHLFRALEALYLAIAPFVYSPHDALKNWQFKWRTSQAERKLPPFKQTKLASCFDSEDIATLAHLMRQHYSSCLWQKGDILLVDNRQVAHAGMPGAGPRLVRAMICNPLDMNYACTASGILECHEAQNTLGGALTDSASRLTDTQVVLNI